MKMLMCLLVSFLLGLTIGYWIWGGLKRLAAEWESKYNKVADEKQELSVSLNETNTKLGSVNKELEVNVSGWKKCKTDLEARVIRIGELDGELSVAKKKIIELNTAATAAAGAATGAAVTTGVKSDGGSDSEEVKSLTLQLERCRARYQGLWEKNQTWSMRLAELEAKTGEVTEPTWLLKEANKGEKDDLKEIHGVGPVMETTMNKLGIFYFHQLAQM